MDGRPAITMTHRRSLCWRRSMAATARRSAIATNSIRRSRLFQLTGRLTISRSTKAHNSRRATKEAPSSPSMVHGTERLGRKADTTSCSNRSQTASRPAITSSSQTASRASTRTQAAPRIARQGWRSGPDGALYIADDKAGRIWRVTYVGDPNAKGIEGAPAPATEAQASPGALPPEGVHPDAGAQSAALPVPPGATSEQVALGKKIFHGEVAGATCAGCHGADGIGTPVGADLASGTWLWGDGSLKSITDIIRNGVPKPKQHPGAMPPFGGVQMSESDLAALAAYVWSIGHQTKG